MIRIVITAEQPRVVAKTTGEVEATESQDWMPGVPHG